MYSNMKRFIRVIFFIVILFITYTSVAVSGSGEITNSLNFNGATEGFDKIFESVEIDFTSSEDQDFLRSGWANTEPEHTWAIGHKADFVFFTFFPQKAKQMTLFCTPFRKLTEQTMAIVVNGSFLGEIPLSTIQKRYAVVIPAEVQQKYRNHVNLIFKKIGRPIDYGINNDQRKLAAAFRKVTFSPYDEGKNLTPEFQKGNFRPFQEEGYLTLPPNSGVRKRIIVKPGSLLTFSLAATADKSVGNFKILLEYDGNSHEMFSGYPEQNLRKYSIDLANYSNHLVHLSFFYESEQPLVQGELATVRFQAILHQDSKATINNYPNILFIVIDTLRADYLGCYGAPIQTPTIDNLAKEGILFRHAYSHIPITLPSHAAMFASAYPHALGVLTNGMVISTHTLTLPKLLGELGFSTYGIVSLSTLDSYTNFGQGLQLYKDTSGDFRSFLTAEDVNFRFSQVVDTLSDQKNWFIFLHYSDPHEPYHAHGLRSNNVEISLNGQSVGRLNVAEENFLSIESVLQPQENVLRFTADKDFFIRNFLIESGEFTWQGRSGITTTGTHKSLSSQESEIEIFNLEKTPQQMKLNLFLTEKQQNLELEEIRESYTQEVEYADRKIGEVLTLLKDRGLLDNTVIILTADHGEGLGDHNLVGHINQLYNSLTHIPLILSYPKSFPIGKTITTRVSHIDLIPTLIDIFDLQVGTSYFSGKSLIPIIEGEEKEDRAVLSMTFKEEAPHNLISLIDEQYKIIRNLDTNQYELYDIVADPDELNDISEQDFLTLNRMERKLEKFMERESFSSNMLPSSQEIILDDRLREKLRGLGYIR